MDSESVPNEASVDLARIKEHLAAGHPDPAFLSISAFPDLFINNVIIGISQYSDDAESILSILRMQYGKDWITLLLGIVASSQANVKSYGLLELFNQSEQDPRTLNGCVTPQHCRTLARLVSDPDTAVYTRAIKVILLLDEFHASDVMRHLYTLLNGTNTTAMCSIFDVAIDLSVKYESCLRLASELGCIDRMILELTNSRDILYQLNILEVLSRLVVTPLGFSCLNERNHFSVIADMVLAEHPMRSIILPGFLKFFGAVAHWHPSEAISYYPAVTDCLFETLASGDKLMLPVALDTLGYIASTVEGKSSLADIDSKMQKAVNCVSEYIRNSPTAIQVRALNCMESLIGLEGDPKYTPGAPVDVKVTLVTREWFRSMNPQANSMEGLYEKCKVPFPELRVASLQLLNAVCQHQWGCEMVANTPGFIEFLLDRSVHHTKETKEAKFKVLQRLSQSPAFEPSVTLRISKYVEQGVFYREADTEVAMEES